MMTMKGHSYIPFLTHFHKLIRFPICCNHIISHLFQPTAKVTANKTSTPGYYGLFLDSIMRRDYNRSTNVFPRKVDAICRTPIGCTPIFLDQGSTNTVHNECVFVSIISLLLRENNKRVTKSTTVKRGIIANQGQSEQTHKNSNRRTKLLMLCCWPLGCIKFPFYLSLKSGWATTP